MEKRIADKQKLEKLVTLIVEKLLDIVDKNLICFTVFDYH